MKSSYRNRVWVWAILLLLSPVFTNAQSCLPRNTSFQEGEKLTFRVYYNMGFVWINSGSAEFTTSLTDINNRKAYHIKGVGRTASSFEWFYKVRDVYESFVDRESMLPLKFLRHVSEGDTKIENEVVFNREKGQVVSDNKVYPVNSCTQDVLSAMYFARNVNYNAYKPGDKISFSMFLDNQVYNLYIKYLGKERITTKAGTYNAIKIKPLLITGTIFKDGDKMTIWLSDDANHLPVRVESPILIGSVKIDLVDYQNLRNPFSGLVSRN